MAFATVDQLVDRLGPSTVEDNHAAELALVLAAAEDDIRAHCGREFDDAGSATARWFFADALAFVDVDDFHTTSGLIIQTDDDDDGTAEITWDASDYLLEPLNGRRNGQSWPYSRIRAVESRTFPRHYSGRPGVYVTARWGWATIPDAVREATLLHAAALFKRRDSPHGVAGFGEFGAIRVRGSMDPTAAALLIPYRKASTAAGIYG